MILKRLAKWINPSKSLLSASYSVLIGQAAQSVVIGLACTERQKKKQKKNGNCHLALAPRLHMLLRRKLNTITNIDVDLTILLPYSSASPMLKHWVLVIQPKPTSQGRLRQDVWQWYTNVNLVKVATFLTNSINKCISSNKTIRLLIYLPSIFLILRWIGWNCINNSACISYISRALESMI